MPSIAAATENGVGAYPLGVNTIMAGATPGPGETWIQNYSVYYNANSFTNSAGDGAVPGFRADVGVNATRVFHNWNVEVGPFQLLSGIVVPVMGSRVRTPLDTTKSFSIGDIEIQPLYLGYVSPDKTFFAYGGIEAYIPTGTDVSNNFYSVGPTLFATWMPTPKWDLSLTLNVEFHSENTDTNYRSGTLFHADWGVNYKPIDSLPTLSVGVGGYVVTQLSDDKLDGAVFQDGFRQEGFAIGPQIAYGTDFGAIAVKWQHEFETKNRTEGDKFWLQVMVPFKL